ncbi:MFS transporter [Paenibacillus sp. N1-5-1-14]|uniref:MFS transporter n=1 Tax=Paenibacillus radicibacter TaxID=2972488 RepID=UPI002158A71B|nr:MFS transporter [Paenibacillus radicibacter]MCR8641029.1 MFS transporter [Paenibacillus radicibacter]
MKKLQAKQVYITMEFMVSFISATMFTTYMVYMMITLGFNPLQLLLIGMVLELTVLVFEGITGVVADIYGRRRSVIIGMFVLGVGFVIEGCALWLGEGNVLFGAFGWVLISQLFFGIGWTFTSGADTAWIVDEVGEEHIGTLFLQTKRIGLIGTLLGIGFSVGLSTLGSNLPYLIGGLLYLVLGVFLILFMKETKFVRAVGTEQGISHFKGMKDTWLSGAEEIRRHPILLMILIVAVLSGAASEGYDRLWQAHLIDGVGFPGLLDLSPAAWFGIIAVIATLLSLVVIAITEKRINMNHEKVAIRGMIVLMGFKIAAILLLAYAESFAVALVAVLLIGIIQTMYEPFYNTWINLNIHSKSRATVLSMLSQADALGQTGGGPVVGWVGKRYGLRASLVTAAALLLPLLAVFSRASKRDKETNM